MGVTSQTPDPAGGKILKDAEGNLTGVFSKHAGVFFMDEVYDPAPEVVDASFDKNRPARQCPGNHYGRHGQSYVCEHGKPVCGVGRS